MAADDPGAPPAATPAEPRPTYQQLITDETLWDMQDIADALDVQYQTVKSWRRDSSGASRRSNQPHPNYLPPPDEVKSGKPLWRAGRVRLWALHTGRMAPTGQAKRSKPRGRPRGKTKDPARVAA